MAAPRKPGKQDTASDMAGRARHISQSYDRQTRGSEQADERQLSGRQTRDERQTLERRNLRLPGEHWQRLEDMANDQKRTISELVREAVREYIERKR